MTRYLDVDVVVEKKIAVKEDDDDEQAQRFVEVKRIPENISLGVIKFIFQDRTGGVVNSIPEAQ